MLFPHHESCAELSLSPGKPGQSDLSTMTTPACSIQSMCIQLHRHGEVEGSRHFIYHHCIKIHRKRLQGANCILPLEINVRNPLLYLIDSRQAGLLGPGAAGALGSPEALLAAPAALHEGRSQQALAAGPEVVAARPRQRDLRYLSMQRHGAQIPLIHALSGKESLYLCNAMRCYSDFRCASRSSTSL